MLDRSIDSFRQYTPATTLTFSDRGIPDSLSYAHLIDLPSKEFLQEACDQYRYAAPVFIAPPWEEIYETDSERKQDF